MDMLGDRDDAREALVSAIQADRVSGFVERARRRCEIVVGGERGEGPGFFYRPTVIANVDNDAAAEFQLDIQDSAVLAAAYKAADFIL